MGVCLFPIRYEREEAFMALNLGVTSCQSLEISLDQFVRGEVLEGSNAYYCEKCKEKVLHLSFTGDSISVACYCIQLIIKPWLLLPVDCAIICFTWVPRAFTFITLIFLQGVNWFLLFLRE